eukprot:m.209981 g.209981  ORF g.209981 m.209981 type:complete len:97 (+) comp39734_c1_seq17:738-1028(+)
MMLAFSKGAESFSLHYLPFGICSGCSIFHVGVAYNYGDHSPTCVRVWLRAMVVSLKECGTSASQNMATWFSTRSWDARSGVVARDMMVTFRRETLC